MVLPDFFDKVLSSFETRHSVTSGNVSVASQKKEIEFNQMINSRFLVLFPMN